MGDEKVTDVKSTLSGWVKAGITSVVGLFSGVILMYGTSVVNNVIKPAKPVPNFSSIVTGTLVSLNNRSTGGTQGWWDFGDGTVLEPFDPKVSNIQHTYAKPGTYSVKLSLQNIIGEHADRAVAVAIEFPVTPPPEITQFQLIPISPNDRAPATFRLVSKTKNASFCIISRGDDLPLEVDDSATQDRYITFDEMGSYTIRLSAVNGKQVVEKSKTVFISPNEGRQPVAKLTAEYSVVKVTKQTKEWRIACEWRGNGDEAAVAFKKESPILPGSKITDAILLNKADASSPVRNVKLEIAPDKTKVIITGEIVKPKNWIPSQSSPPPVWHAHIRAEVVRRSAPLTINRGDVIMAVALNGTTKMPMQPLEEGWEIVGRKVNLELWDGSRKAWEGSEGVTNARVSLMNQSCIVTAIPQADGFMVKIDAPTGQPANNPLVPVTVLPPPSPSTITTPIGPTIRPASFDRNVLQPFRKKSKD